MYITVKMCFIRVKSAGHRTVSGWSLTTPVGLCTVCDHARKNSYDVSLSVLAILENHLLKAFIFWNIRRSRELTFDNQHIFKKIWSVHMAEKDVFYIESDLVVYFSTLNNYYSFHQNWHNDNGSKFTNCNKLTVIIAFTGRCSTRILQNITANHI